MNSMSLITSIPCANTLGEGVQWNHQDGCVWWTDILEAKLYRYQLEGEHLQHWDLPERLGCFAFAKHDARMLMAFASGFAWFSPDTGACEWIAKPEADMPGNRSNDGRCDRQGRFWMGAIVEQESELSAQRGAGLYCLNHKLQVSRHLGGIKISNALCWNPEGTKLYHANSPTHTIHVYDFDGATGTLSNPQVFAQTEQGIEPDGACVDADGCLWNAQWGGARVRRYQPDGTLDFELSTPVTQPTCIAFGGPNYDLLFVTSAAIGLSSEQRELQPEAGNLLIYKTPYKGLPESWFGE